jgi:sulfite oxidase
VSRSRLTLRLADPFNGGTPLEVLGRSVITPVDAFYVRNHGPLPVPASEPRLTVDGLVLRPATYQLADLLTRLPRHELVATLQCAGNRRAELSVVKPTGSPLQWGPDAIGTALWSGIRLADVLELVGVRPAAAHVAFEGSDRVATEAGMTLFGGSVPLAKALQPEVLLVDRMNREPLRPDHGAPLRALVPGYIGARSVKWLSRITLLDGPSDNWFQASDYRLNGRPLGETTLNSAITEPADGATLRAGSVTVRGYALASAGRRLRRVELSTDGGVAWAPTELETDQDGAWSWRLWQRTVELAAGPVELVVRATDDAGTQPADPAQLWNSGGYGNTAWHRIRIQLRA